MRAGNIARSFWLGSHGKSPSYRKFFGSARATSVNEPAWWRRYFWNSRKTRNGPKWRMAKFVGKNIRQRWRYRIFFFLAFVLFFSSFSLSYNVTVFPLFFRARRCADIRNVHSSYSSSFVVDLKTKIKCTVSAATFIYLFKLYVVLALFTYGEICAIINRSILKRKIINKLTRHRVTD